MGGARSTQFWSEIMNSTRGKVTRVWKDNTKIDRKEIGRVGGYGLDSYGLGKEQMAGSCKR
jgi:hypothetical protein